MSLQRIRHFVVALILSVIVTAAGTIPAPASFEAPRPRDVSACTSVTASAAPASPFTSGTAITFTGSASGCTHPLYEFWMLAPGSSAWQLVQGYSASAVYHWNSTGALAGTEHFSVWARDANSAGTPSLGSSYDAYTGIPYTVATSCTSVTASVAPASPSKSGTAVTFTGSASGCANPLYEFWMLAPGSSTWTMVQAYSSNATFKWNTTGLAVGTYRVSVWVRDAGSAGTSCGSLGCNDAYLPSTAYTLT
jgi:hypothetical protein